MLALGCLFPVFFCLGGAVLGAWAGGQHGALWGGLAGIGIGIVLPIAGFAWLIRRRRAKRDAR